MGGHHQVRVNAALYGIHSDDVSAQDCVKRRAILSVSANPHCLNREMAERTVNEVWDSCFRDTRPFDEVRLALKYVWTWLNGLQIY